MLSVCRRRRRQCSANENTRLALEQHALECAGTRARSQYTLSEDIERMTCTRQRDSSCAAVNSECARLSWHARARTRTPPWLTVATACLLDSFRQIQTCLPHGVIGLGCINTVWKRFRQFKQFHGRLKSAFGGPAGLLSDVPALPTSGVRNLPNRIASNLFGGGGKAQQVQVGQRVALCLRDCELAAALRVVGNASCVGAFARLLVCVG